MTEETKKRKEEERKTQKATEQLEIEKIYRSFVDENVQVMQPNGGDPGEQYDFNTKSVKYVRDRFPREIYVDETLLRKNWVQIVYESLVRTPYASDGGVLKFLQELDKARKCGIDFNLLLKAGIIAGVLKDTGWAIEEHEMEWKGVLANGATIAQQRWTQWCELHKILLQIQRGPSFSSGLLYATPELTQQGKFVIEYRLHPRLRSILQDFECLENFAAYKREWLTLSEREKTEFSYLSPVLKKRLEKRIKDTPAIRFNNNEPFRVLNSEFPSHCKKMFEAEEKWLTENGLLSEKFSMIFDNGPYFGQQFTCWHIEYVQRIVPEHTNASRNENVDIHGEIRNQRKSRRNDPFDAHENIVFLKINQQKLLYPRETNVLHNLYEYLKWKAEQKHEAVDESELPRIKGRYYNFLKRAYHTPDFPGKDDKDIGNFGIAGTPEYDDRWHFYLDCKYVDKTTRLRGLLYYDRRTGKYYLLAGGVLYPHTYKDELESKGIRYFVEKKVKEKKVKMELITKAKYDTVKAVAERTGRKTFTIWEIVNNEAALEKDRECVPVYVVQKKIRVKSPSFAAYLVSGYVRNGRKCWKNSKGESIEDLGLPSCEHRKKEKPKPRKSKSK